jgi:hypothetical protein
MDNARSRLHLINICQFYLSSIFIEILSSKITFVQTIDDQISTYAAGRPARLLNPDTNRNAAAAKSTDRTAARLRDDRQFVPASPGPPPDVSILRGVALGVYKSHDFPSLRLCKFK